MHLMRNHKVNFPMQTNFLNPDSLQKERQVKCQLPQNHLHMKIKNMAKHEKYQKCLKSKSNVSKPLMPLVLQKKLENVGQLTRSHDRYHRTRL